MVYAQWSSKDVNAIPRESRASLGQFSLCPYKCPHFCSSSRPFVWLVQIYHPRGNPACSGISGLILNEVYCVLVPMGTVWMGRLRGAITLSPHKNCPFLFHTQIYDHFHYKMSSYSGRHSLVHKIPNFCKQLFHKGNTEQHHWLTYNKNGESLHDQCTKTPGRTSQNSNFKFMEKK